MFSPALPESALVSYEAPIRIASDLSWVPRLAVSEKPAMFARRSMIDFLPARRTLVGPVYLPARFCHEAARLLALIDDQRGYYLVAVVLDTCSLGQGTSQGIGLGTGTACVR